jgi:hypothetical protein
MYRIQQPVEGAPSELLLGSGIAGVSLYNQMNKLR